MEQREAQPRTEDVSQSMDKHVVVGWATPDYEDGFTLLHIEGFTLYATETPRLTEAVICEQLATLKGGALYRA